MNYKQQGKIRTRREDVSAHRAGQLGKREFLPGLPMTGADSTVFTPRLSGFIASLGLLFFLGGYRRRKDEQERIINENKK
jgi:LPXTG-motif cell wall-anchored protein